MNLLLLPGNSPRHAQWIEALKSALRPHAHTITAHHYAHWRTGAERANIPEEISAAAATTQNLAPYTIIAKSIGTAIAVQGVAAGAFTPEKIILLGVPIEEGGVITAAFMHALSQLTIPIIIIQNTHDPYGSFADTKTRLSAANPQLVFIEAPGETHDYTDFELVARYI